MALTTSNVGHSSPTSGTAERQRIFEAIYRKRVWSRNVTQQDGGSGSGSTLVFTRGIRALLSELFDTLNISSVLDAPCGGMEWQQTLLKDIGAAGRSLRYEGIDIVPSVIQKHRKRYLRWTNVSFKVLDMANDPVPRGHDLIFSRDALQHNKPSVIVSTLRNWAQSDAKWLLVSSYPNATRNIALRMRGVEAGKSFDIDLRKPPYCLEPTRMFRETLELSDPWADNSKFLYLYEVRLMRDAVDAGFVDLECWSNVTFARRSSNVSCAPCAARGI